MADITTLIAIARDHVKSDGDDDNLLTQYATSAVAVAGNICRRNLYWSQDELDTAKGGFTAALTAAENAWQTAKDTYDVPASCPETAQDRINAAMLESAWKTYVATLNRLSRINDGMVIDDVILAALLLITGHLYKNRQEVIAGATAVAVQIPMGAERILQPYMAV